jgi:hypothetical protein
MTVLIAILALIAVALLIVPWSDIFPPQANVTVAHSQPLPAPSPSATAVPSPVAAVKVTGASGPICILPTGKGKHAVEVVKVP